MKNENLSKTLIEEFIAYEFPANVVSSSIEMLKEIMFPIMKKDVRGTSFVFCGGGKNDRDIEIGELVEGEEIMFPLFVNGPDDKKSLITIEKLVDKLPKDKYFNVKLVLYRHPTDDSLTAYNYVAIQVNNRNVKKQ